MTDDNKQVAATLAAAIIHSTSPDKAVAVYRSCLDKLDALEAQRKEAEAEDRKERHWVEARPG